MHTRTIASLLLLALLALALGGCAQEHEPPARPRAGVDEEGFLEPVTYLVRGFVLPGDFAELDPSAQAPGFDLDGLVTDWDAPPGGCEQVFLDFDSALDPTERGVDNALAILEPVIDEWIQERGGESLSSELARAVAEGRLLLAIEVSGVDHWAAIHTPQSCWQVLSDGFSLLHADDAWYLDLAPDFAAPASPAVVSRSPFHVRGAVVRYAELPYDYPRA